MDYQVIDLTGKALMRLLWTRIPAALATAVTLSENDIVLTPPPVGAGGGTKLSVFLYQVTENPFLKNRPMVAEADPRRLRYPPLSLVLHYLITPSAASIQAENLLLGKAMEIFHDHGVLQTSAVNGAPANAPPELHIALDAMSLEDLTRIWGAINQDRGYKLSVAYRVTPVEIDSTRLRRVERVVHKTSVYDELPVPTS